MLDRIRISASVSPDALAKAQADAASHPDEVIGALRFTEHNPEWVLLYDHARLGQIRPEDMKAMRQADLVYLAGMTRLHGELDEGQAARLAGNVARATIELQRRSTRVVVWWTSAVGAGAALIGAIVGGLIAKG